MGGSQLIDAARQIQRSNDMTLMVGCTKEQLCGEPRKMPDAAELYTETPRRGEMAKMVQKWVAREALNAELAHFQLDQNLPTGLYYVDGSGQPEPIVATDGERTRLRWEWTGEDASGAHAVTYSVLPGGEGEWAIDGLMEFADSVELTRTLPIPSIAITVAGQCESPPTKTPIPPTATPTEERPTDTPVPTATPTWTPVPTPVPEPIFLPIALWQVCHPDEKLGDVVLVVDMSTSMDRPTEDGVAKKDAVLTAAGLFLNRLDFTPNDKGQHDQVAVVGFNDTAWIQQSLTRERGQIDAALMALPARQAQGTRLDLAFDVAGEALAADLRKPDNRPVVIFLTDGLPNRVPLDPESGRMEETVLKAADRLKEQDITIYTIGFGRADAGDPADRVDPWLLEQCASGPDKVFIEPSADRLSAIYAEIAEVIACPGKTWP